MSTKYTNIYSWLCIGLPHVRGGGAGHGHTQNTIILIVIVTYVYPVYITRTDAQYVCIYSTKNGILSILYAVYI